MAYLSLLRELQKNSSEAVVPVNSELGVQDGGAGGQAWRESLLYPGEVGVSGRLGPYNFAGPSRGVGSWSLHPSVYGCRWLSAAQVS